MHTIFVGDLDARVEVIDRGIEPAQQVNYSNGVRTTTYPDPDGNEIVSVVNLRYPRDFS